MKYLSRFSCKEKQNWHVTQFDAYSLELSELVTTQSGTRLQGNQTKNQKFQPIGKGGGELTTTFWKNEEMTKCIDENVTTHDG